jgi:DNA-binding transcriptional regulator of glucitol operon
MAFVHERWLSRRAFGLHLLVLLFVPGCAAAAWWQITRATDGNGLSYLYAIEWPIFAILGVYFWWMFIHTDYDTVGLKGMRNRTARLESPVAESETEPALVASPVFSSPVDPSDDPELAAYNARLAELSRQGANTWRSPERTVVRRST